MLHKFSCYTLEGTFRLSSKLDSMWRKLKAPIKITWSSRHRIPGLLTDLYSRYDIRLSQLLLIEVKLMKRANLLNSAMKSMPLIYHLQLTKFIQSKLIRLSIWSKCSFVMQQLEHHYQLSWCFTSLSLTNELPCTQVGFK